MLEHPKLWLHLWCDYRKRAGGRVGEAAGAGPPVWAFLEPSRRKLVGLVRRQRFPTAWLWFGAVAWPVAEVLEDEDESLLFTLDRYVGFRASWLVRDADGQRLGTIRGHEVRDACGQALGCLRWNGDGRRGRWLGMGGQELGTVARSRDGIEAAFGPEVDENPFAKMVFLATLLRDEP